MIITQIRPKRKKNRIFCRESRNFPKGNLSVQMSALETERKENAK